jgi:integrase
MKRNQLTTKQVQAAKAPAGKRATNLADGGGLYLQVSAYGTKSWEFRYQLNGERKCVGLGSVDTFSLAEARIRAKKLRQQLADGIDPKEEKERKKAEALAKAAALITFEDCAKQYIDTHASGWKNEKHRQQWKSTLATYAFPVIGKLPVNQVDLPHVLNILQPIWEDKTETAARVRSRVEKVLSWATARKYRSGDNPARWVGCLDTLLKAKSKTAKGKAKKHHAALPWTEAPAFMGDLRGRNYVSARALELCILTCTRTSETIGARWEEFDLKSKVWTVPAARMKNGKPHRIPLCARAIEVLKDVAKDPEFVFVNGGGKPLSNMAMLELLRGMRPGLTVHGFRSTFTDWARENTNYSRDTVEMAASHTIKDKTEAAYRRGDLLEKRIKLMNEWCRYCSSTPATADNVVSIRA